MSGGGGSCTSNEANRAGGDWSQLGITLSNTLYSEIAPCLSLPSLPVFCGAVNQQIQLSDELPFRNINLAPHARKIADLLRNTDVLYLNLKSDENVTIYGDEETSDLYEEVLRCNPGAFEYSLAGDSGLGKKQNFCSAVDEGTPQRQERVPSLLRREYVNERNDEHDILNNDAATLARKSKARKGRQVIAPSIVPDPAEHQESVLERSREYLEDFCSGAEVPSDDHDEADWISVPVSDIKVLVNEINLMQGEKILKLVPPELLTRTMHILDNQIHRAEGLSVCEYEHSDSDVSLVLCALESIHASLTLLIQPEMPKQLYKEEIIERILEFSRRHIMDVMAARDPSFRALHRPRSNGADEGEEDESVDIGSASKKRNISRSGRPKKTTNRVSAASDIVFQKLCTILKFLKDLLLIERLSDSYILQLVKTCLSTFMVDNIQLLQLKSISLISGIFYSYSQHRTYIMDGVAQLLWKLPSTKRVARTYHISDEEQHEIQMITALLLQLVHHSSNLPDTLRHSSDNAAILGISLDSDYLVKCHEAATETCVLFWTHILQRITAAKSQDASESKAILENLVLDLLTTLNVPEYPASTLLLEVLCVLLLQNAGPKSKDASIRSTAIDLFGTIAARLKRDFTCYNAESCRIMQGLVESASEDDNPEQDSCCMCSDVHVENLMVACQGCQKLFHAKCMGVKEQDISSRGWFCPFCLSRKQLLLLHSYCRSQVKDIERNSNPVSEKSFEATDSVSQAEIVQQVLLNYLQDARSPDDPHVFTSWFYLCLWYKDTPKLQQNISYILARLKSKSIIRDSGGSCSLLTRGSLKRLTTALGRSSSFCRGFDRILSMLLGCLRENSPITRAKALRAVSLIVEADPDVLCESRVQSAVEGRFCDSAISVREAALELVGRHIASHPDVGLKYFQKICERVKDTGVSVRKRSIKIIRDMCIANNFPELIHACSEIISRISDEESTIQDLVCRTIYEFWFEEPLSMHGEHFGDNSAVPLEVANKTEQIVDMLRKTQNYQPLVTIVKRNLALDFFPQSAKAAGINPVSLATVRRRCELICKCLLEKILQVQEMTSLEGEVRTLPYITVLHAFCTVDPALCVPKSDPSQFVVTLQPYLKNQVDNRITAKLQESIIFIIDSVLPFLRRLPDSLIDELERDLKHMIVRHSFLTVVHASIKCLCSMGRLAGNEGLLIELLIKLFFKRLDSIVVENKQQAGRSLFCLGLLIRYGNPLLSASNRVLDLGSSLNLFKKYLAADDFAIKIRALQALGYFLIARPECMLEKDVGKIIRATLSSRSDVGLKLQSLQNMYEYLVDAESQMASNVVDKDGDSSTAQGGSTVPVAAGAGDTNICGGIVQLYWNNLLERSLDSNDQVRQTALKIIEVVLRQGLVHPITCVPYLIALETDPHEGNSKLAHHLLMNMNEKYPTFLESRLGDGIQFSFHFIQSLKGIYEDTSPMKQSKVGRHVKDNPEDLALLNARLGVSRIYKLIRGNRVARNKFMSSVVRKYDNPRWSDTAVPFLMYCTDILALLPFTSPDEPLYLIYTINRVIQVRSGTLEATLKALSQYFSERSFPNPDSAGGDGQKEPVTVEVSAQPAAHSVNFQPEKLNEVHFASSVIDGRLDSENTNRSRMFSEEYLHRIQADCVAATALQLLLKLKRHLKIVYNLDDVRCQAFSPIEPSKSVEALSKQNIPFNTGDLHTEVPSTPEELTQRYQEYKNALREDTVDYSTYTANIKRKRPPPVRNTPVKSSPAKRGGKAGRGGVRPVRNMDGYDDDDDDYDDDEVYTGGRVQGPFHTVRRGYQLRTRQQF